MARPISDKYRRRVAAVGRETLILRSRARGVLKGALQQAHDEQLTNVSNLPLTGRMRRSIKSRFVRDGVEAYYDTSVAPYAGPRLNKKGRSKKGGHIMDMKPGPKVRQISRPRLRQMEQQAHGRIVEGR